MRVAFVGAALFFAAALPLGAMATFGLGSLCLDKYLICLAKLSSKRCGKHRHCNNYGKLCVCPLVLAQHKNNDTLRHMLCHTCAARARKTKLPHVFHCCPSLFMPVHSCPTMSVAVNVCPSLSMTAHYCPSLSMIVNHCPCRETTARMPRDEIAQEAPNLPRQRHDNATRMPRLCHDGATRAQRDCHECATKAP